MLMSDFELLMIIATVGLLIVAIMDLKKKSRPVPGKISGFTNPYFAGAGRTGLPYQLFLL